MRHKRSTSTSFDAGPPGAAAATVDAELARVAQGARWERAAVIFFLGLTVLGLLALVWVAIGLPAYLLMVGEPGLQSVYSNQLLWLFIASMTVVTVVSGVQWRLAMRSRARYRRLLAEWTALRTFLAASQARDCVNATTDG